MYEKVIPHKDFRGKVHNLPVQFNLTIPETVKLLEEFQLIFEWQDSMEGADRRELTSAEVVAFYSAFERVLLASWGELSSDGAHFRKAGRYDFEDSALFAGCMEYFLSDPQAAVKFLDDVLPDNMEKLMRSSEENLQKMKEDPDASDELKQRIAQLEEQNARLRQPVAPQE